MRKSMKPGLRIDLHFCRKKGPRRREKLPESRRVTVDPCEREKLESLLLFSRKEESLFGWMEVLAFLIVNFSSVSREYLRT